MPSRLFPGTNTSNSSIPYSPHHAHAHRKSESFLSFSNSPTSSLASPELCNDSKVFFRETGLKGKLARVRNHKWERDEVGYYEGYGRAALDWHSIQLHAHLSHSATAMPSSLPPSPPKRILDIGCGINAEWIITMLHHPPSPAWGREHYVGLDIAPVPSLEHVLPHSHQSRTSFVQHDFLAEALPFGDARFGLVRLGTLSRGIPEHMWEKLLEECRRVLIPGGRLLINDTNFNQRLVTALLSSPSISPAFSPTSRALIAKCLQISTSVRFLNPHPLSIIPPALVLNCNKVLRGEVWGVEEGEEGDGRVMTHAFANYMECLGVLAGEELAKEMEEDLKEKVTELDAATMGRNGNTLKAAVLGPYYRPSTTTLGEGGGDVRWKLQKEKMRIRDEVGVAFGEWVDDLIRRAGLAELVEKWGWKCKVDEEMERKLEALVPTLEVILKGFKEDEDWEEEMKVDLERELRKAQIKFAEREARNELKEVRKRLGRETSMGKGSLGKFEYGEWVAVV